MSAGRLDSGAWRLFADEGRRFSQYEKLMPHRVRDILLVASLYDSFILAEDGQLNELILDRYVDLNLRYAPRVRRVSTGAEALAAIEEQSFDLVLTMSRLPDMTVPEFGSAVRGLGVDLPVVLLLYHLDSREQASAYLGAGFDEVFLWSGDATILLAIIKLIEDRANAEPDTTTGGVQVILLVEDSVRFASSYLPLIYTELVKQTQSLMAEGLNAAHRLLRQAARPKILLARDFETACRLYRRYQGSLMGAISDVRFPVRGVPNPAAGLDFIRMVRANDADLPLVLQSSNAEIEPLAHALGAGFIHKHSPTLLADLRGFMLNSLGFGDFVFRDELDREIGRAVDIRDLARKLDAIPDSSLLSHAGRSHFSNWLKARTEFALAARVREIRVDESRDADRLRDELELALGDFLVESQKDVVAEFSRARFDRGSVFVKIGAGSLGGKGRGLAFFNSLLSRFNLREAFDDVRIAVPNTAVIGTDVFDRFLAQGDLLNFVITEPSDAEIVERFLIAKLPSDIYDDLRAFLGIARYPLAVRSSSLLEDSYTRPFAGVYETIMLSNRHGDAAVRLDQLCDAIKLVYASTFFEQSRRYMASTGLRPEEEKMAVIVQQLVGAPHGDVFYPEISGVARSWNFYPYGKTTPEDGVAYVALGLGKTVVEGGRALRFCPADPRRLPHFSTVDGILENAQRDFFALDLSHPEAYPAIGDRNLRKLDLDAALEHGSLSLIGSVYSPENHAVYDGTGRSGIPLVTFAQVLKRRLFPLAEIISKVLELTRRTMSVPVEIEFAARLSSDDETPHEFGFLQLRPLVEAGHDDPVSFDESRHGDRAVIARSDMVLGNGHAPAIHDIVVIAPDRFDRSKTHDYAAAIARLNASLGKEGRRFLLIGPGRWGSSDEWLGIPVNWSQISGAAAIVEVSLETLRIEPSQGTHFFQNLTSFGVFYLTIAEGRGEAMVDWDGLARCPIAQDLNGVHHLRLEDPVEILVDGRGRKGLVRLVGPSP